MKILNYILLLFSSSFLLSLDFSFDSLPIQESGRIKPIDSYARNQLLRFYGKTALKNEDGSKQTAFAWFEDVLINTEEEILRPIFNVRNPDVTTSLGLERVDNHKYSFFDIINGFRDNQDLIESLKTIKEDKLTLVEKQIVEVYRNVILFDEIAHSLYCFLPVIKVENSVIREYMNISSDQNLSYSFFMRNIDKFKILLQDLLQTEEKDWNDSHLELSQIAMYLQNLTQYHYAQSLKIIPSFDNKENDAWLSPWELMDGRSLNDNQKQVLLNYENLIFNLIENNEDGAKISSNEIIMTIDDYYLDFKSTLLNKEVSYNKNNIFLYSLVFYIIAFLLVGVSWMFKPALFRNIALYSILSGFVMHAYGLISRMIIMQRPPVSTLYESIIFVSFILVLFALIFEFLKKDTIGILIASIGGSLLHFVGFKYAADGDTLGMLVAVLNSNFWLATHVTTITIGYGVSLVAGLMGHIYLFLATFKPQLKDELKKIFNNTYGLTLMALFFTMFGTILGGIWADQSWGRFWGWDPKENGALLIVLWLLMMLHLRISGMVKHLGYAFGVSFVNIVVVLAWFGVNLLSVGLHSYGFTDNVATNLFIYILCELLFIFSFYFLAKKRLKLS